MDNKEIIKDANTLQRASLYLQNKNNPLLGYGHHQDIVQNIHDICIRIQQVTQAMNNEILQLELGNLIISGFDFCLYCGFTLEETIQKSLLKFNTRFGFVKELATRDGYQNFNDLPMKTVMIYWDKAKEMTYSSNAAASGCSNHKVNESETEDLLEEVVKAELKALNFGFKWFSSDQLIKQIHDECREVVEVFDIPSKRDALQEELGDLILASFSFCIYCDFNPTEAIEKIIDVGPLERAV